MGSLHQGMETSISKVWKRVNFGNDMTYNWELMGAMNETKGCLYRNARFVLCGKGECLSCRLEQESAGDEAVQSREGSGDERVSGNV